MNATDLKNLVLDLGADLCGLASMDRFEGAPQGFHPTDVLPGCRTVAAFALKFPASTLKATSNSPYTHVRNRMVLDTDRIGFEAVRRLDRLGLEAVPIPSADPYDYWDETRTRGMGVLSLKHAAARAGLGFMGKNTLLITPEFGNMVWLGALLLTEELEPDPWQPQAACPDKCNICLELCPTQALDGTTLDQARCRPKSTASSPGGGWVLSCNLCRAKCPKCRKG